MSDAGPFDVLNGLEAPAGRLVPYEELAGRANTLYVSGMAVRAVALEDIIAAKERADRPKDREALPALRAKRDERAAGHVARGAPGVHKPNQPALPRNPGLGPQVLVAAVRGSVLARPGGHAILTSVERAQLEAKRLCICASSRSGAP